MENAPPTAPVGKQTDDGTKITKNPGHTARKEGKYNIIGQKVPIISKYRRKRKKKHRKNLLFSEGKKKSVGSGFPPTIISEWESASYHQFPSIFFFSRAPTEFCIQYSPEIRTYLWYSRKRNWTCVIQVDFVQYFLLFCCASTLLCVWDGCLLTTRKTGWKRQK